MGRIVFFDIDGTLFNRNRFLKDFDNLLKNEYMLSNNELEEIVNLYEVVKKDFGFFSYQDYLQKIYKKIPNLNNKFDFYFQQENINRYLFPDSEILSSLKNTRIGIFSKGDSQFQKMKIKKFSDILEEDLIYIFHNKIKHIQEVLNNNINAEIYLVDDRVDVLISAKNYKKEVKTVLIDRKNEFDEVNGIDFRIEKLSDIISVLA